MRRDLVLGSMLLGCATVPPDEARHSGPSGSAVCPQPSPTASPEMHTPAVPEFARFDVDLAAIEPRRARLAGGASVFDVHSEQSWSSNPPLDAAREVVVIDDRTMQGARWLTIACVEPAYRIVGRAPAEGFATVAARNLEIRPALAVDGPSGGLVRAGQPLQVIEATSDGVLVQYEGDIASVRGRVEAGGVDLVYTPQWWPDAFVAMHPDARLRRAVSLEDKPGGASFARIEAVTIEWDVSVEVLERRATHALIVYADAEARVVGWVPNRVLARDDEPGVYGSIDVGPFRGGGGLHSWPIAVEAGTVLRSPNTAEPIGVVTRPTELKCIAECDGPRPHVRVDACWRLAEATFERSVGTREGGIRAPGEPTPTHEHLGGRG